MAQQDMTIREMIAAFEQPHQLAPGQLYYKVSRLKAWERGKVYAPSTIARWANQLRIWLRENEREA